MPLLTPFDAHSRDLTGSGARRGSPHRFCSGVSSSAVIYLIPHEIKHLPVVASPNSEVIPRQCEMREVLMPVLVPAVACSVIGPMEKADASIDSWSILARSKIKKR